MHSQVGDYHGKGHVIPQGVLEGIYRRPAITGNRHGVAVRFQNAAQGFRHQRVVIHDKNPF
jgi:hypothetical protein